MEENYADIYRLPTECMSIVLSLTSPRDACRSALVSTRFRSEVNSDALWDRFLQPDVLQIISQAVNPVQFLNKRDLYFRLFDPLLINGGKMSFSLDKSTGAKCYTMSARELVILWGDIPYYWKWIAHSDSRFSEVAELLYACLLEISWKIDTQILSPRMSYAAYLLYKFAKHGSVGLFDQEQEAAVRVGAHVSKHVVCLHPEGAVIQQEFQLKARCYVRMWVAPFQLRGEEDPMEEETSELLRAPSLRGDGWLEMELGDFFSGDGDDVEVEVSLTEVKGLKTKSGLVIQGVEVRPKK